MLGDRPRVDAATLSKADNEMLFVMSYECRRVGARGSRGKKSKYEEFDKAAGIEGLPRGTLQGRRLKARERLEPAFEAMQADIDALRARSLEVRLIEPPELKQPLRPSARRCSTARSGARRTTRRARPVAVSPGDAVTSLFDDVIWDGIVDRVEGDAVEVHYFLDHNMHTHKVDELRVLRPAAGCLGALRERGDGDAMDVPAPPPTFEKAGIFLSNTLWPYDTSCSKCCASVQLMKKWTGHDAHVDHVSVGGVDCDRDDFVTDALGRFFDSALAAATYRPRFCVDVADAFLLTGLGLHRERDRDVERERDAAEVVDDERVDDDEAAAFDDEDGGGDSAKKDQIVAMMDAALASTARVARGAWPDVALCVKPEWLEKILRGEKTVDLRGTISKKAGTRFGLICSGTSTRDTADELRARVKYRNCYAWFVKDAVVYETGFAYVHPRGAIGWVDLTKSVAEHPRFRQRSPPRKSVAGRPRKKGKTTRSF
ncbi:hypothetical protein JL722_7282 [Aureococcus anophagefferens]|nr:hypothetical protein JL722_7282 [Aureococcus anophagefferens]